MIVKNIALLLLIAFGTSSFGQTPSSGFGRSRLTRDDTERAADRRPLLIAAGEDKTVDIDFAPDDNRERAFRIGNPEVIAVTKIAFLNENKTQLIFKGLKAGETTVAVRDKDGNLRVVFDVDITGKDLVKLKAELDLLLRDIEGITLRIQGQKIVIDGEFLVPEDYGRLFNVINDPAYAPFVLNLSRLSTVSLQVISRRIQRDVNAFAPNATTRVVNGQVWLEGTVDDAFQARRAERIANLYLPAIRPQPLISKDPDALRLPRRSLVQNFLIINPPPPRKQQKLVKIAVHFVELNKDYSRFFGFKWQPGYTSEPQITIGQNDQTGQTGAGGTSFTAVISSLFPRLLTAQKAGYARILRTGTLIVRSGRKADLVDRQQIPFTVVGPNGQVGASTAQAGLSIAITPVILGQSEDIELDVDISQISVVNFVQDQPVTNESAVKTKIYVKSNESAALAGLSSADVTTNFNNDDPQSSTFGGNTTTPLFSLLRSKNYQKRKKQFVIFVTPQIIENAATGSRDLKRNFRIKVR